MSDVIYSKARQEDNVLSNNLMKINSKLMDITELHGDWGSLALTHNKYNGFGLFEDEKFICVVLGGPVLNFSNNNFIGTSDSNEGTRSILDRFVSGNIKWDIDLDGPFFVVFVNKLMNEVVFVTDLMSFIPVFKFEDEANIVIGTHTDAVAKVAGVSGERDLISIADFILNDVITYPFTFYKDVFQIMPASVHYVISGKYKVDNYWLPDEVNSYKSIKDAAIDLRLGTQKYTDSIVKNSRRIAHFMSGGEDSRTVASLLGNSKQKDAFIFLDLMNREGKIAKNLANIYGSNININYRDKLFYLNNLEICSDLVGSGAQYTHVHTYDFHESCHLDEYDAVFGGFISDTFLKGHHIIRNSKYKRFMFLPQFAGNMENSHLNKANSLFNQEIFSEVQKRRVEHKKLISTFRENTADEWFFLWPISMSREIPNLHGNRRLFRSFEPFTCSTVVKVSAGIPQKWKLNRRIFQKAFKPHLKKSKWQFHGEGRLPYFPWYVNCFVQFFVWAFRGVKKRTGLLKGNQGPWGDWNFVLKSKAWNEKVSKYETGFNEISNIFTSSDVNEITSSNLLKKYQKINVLQTMYYLSQAGEPDRADRADRGRFSV